jgi:hypothetical protein
MQLLYIISILCFLALVSAAIAIARYIHSPRHAPPEQRSFAEHFNQTAIDQNARRLRPLEPQTVRGVMAKKIWNQSETQANASPSSKVFSSDPSR